jgi:hypothetical protein
MEEKILKSGEITDRFRLWMEATFGWDIGQFILLENWVGKHIPCKYDPKSWGIRSGYYEADRFTLAECHKWELVEFDNHISLRFWYKYGDDAEFATTQTYLIEKCIRLPRIEQLDMESYGL